MTAVNKIIAATDGQNAAGLSYLRVPLGASDFSASGKSFLIYSSNVNLKYLWQLTAMTTPVAIHLLAALTLIKLRHTFSLSSTISNLLTVF